MVAVCKTEFFDGTIRHRAGKTYEVNPKFARHFDLPEQDTPAEKPEAKKPGRKPAEKPIEKADEKPADDFLDTKLEE